jgi:hypothetical protein
MQIVGLTLVGRASRRPGRVTRGSRLGANNGSGAHGGIGHGHMGHSHISRAKNQGAIAHLLAHGHTDLLHMERSPKIRGNTQYLPILWVFNYMLKILVILKPVWGDFGHYWRI